MHTIWEESSSRISPAFLLLVLHLFKMDHRREEKDPNNKCCEQEESLLDHSRDPGVPLPGLFLPPGFLPAPYTVVIGKRKFHSGFIGLQRLRILATTVLPKYAEAKSKKEKSEVISGIVKTIRDACPVGAFVKFQDGRFWDVDDYAAREKVGYVLRDLLHSKYRSSSKSKSAIRHQKTEKEKADGKLVSKKDDHTPDGSELKQKASTLARQGSSERGDSIEIYHQSQYASIDNNNKSENKDDTSVVQSSATKTLDSFLDPFLDIHYKPPAETNPKMNNLDYVEYSSAERQETNQTERRPRQEFEGHSTHNPIHFAFSSAGNQETDEAKMANQETD
jgi:hypothetical protein